MNEILLLMVLLFAAYLFLPSTWFAGFFSKANRNSQFNEKLLLIPEDSVLRRHYITQLRMEIEMELYKRPSDSSLKRCYDAVLAENSSVGLSA